MIIAGKSGLGLVVYTIYPDLADKVDSIYQQASTADTESILRMYASPSPSEGLRVNSDNYERNRLPQLADVPWQAGSLTPLAKNDRTGQSTFYKIEEILPSGLKELDEARGYVIADFQDQLEMEWVTSLRAKYPVKMRNRVFEKMVQK